MILSFGSCCEGPRRTICRSMMVFKNPSDCQPAPLRGSHPCLHAAGSAAAAMAEPVAGGRGGGRGSRAAAGTGGRGRGRGRSVPLQHPLQRAHNSLLALCSAKCINCSLLVACGQPSSSKCVPTQATLNILQDTHVLKSQGLLFAGAEGAAVAGENSPAAAAHQQRTRGQRQRRQLQVGPLVQQA